MSPDDALPDPFAIPPAEAPAAAAPARTAAAAGDDRPHVPDAGRSGWVEIVLHDDAGAPVAGERFRARLPGGRIAEGRLDDNGFARLWGFDPGECEVSFPDQDRSAWERA